MRCGAGDLPLIPAGKAYQLDENFAAQLITITSGVAFKANYGTVANVEGFSTYTFGGGMSPNVHILGIKKDGTTVVSTGTTGSIADCVLAIITSTAAPGSQYTVTLT